MILARTIGPRESHATRLDRLSLQHRVFRQAIGPDGEVMEAWQPARSILSDLISLLEWEDGDAGVVIIVGFAPE